MAEALAAGHRGPPARIADQFVTRGADTLLCPRRLDRRPRRRREGGDGRPRQRRPRPALGAGRAAPLRRRHRRARGGDRLRAGHPLEDRRRFAARRALLARPDARRLLVLGAGAVAASLIEAYRAGFPGIAVSLWNRTPAAAGASPHATGAERRHRPAGRGRGRRHRRHRHHRPPRRSCAAPGSAPASTSTSSAPTAPTCARRTTRRSAAARIFVDSFETTLEHIGELRDPLARGVIARADVLGDLARPRRRPRRAATAPPRSRFSRTAAGRIST